MKTSTGKFHGGEPFLCRRGVTKILLGVLVIMAVAVNPILAQKVTCVAEDGSLTVIPEDRINDNYCDCPFTGVDEPETAACAGSRHWPGRAEDANDSERYVVMMRSMESVLLESLLQFILLWLELSRATISSTILRHDDATLNPFFTLPQPCALHLSSASEYQTIP